MTEKKLTDKEKIAAMEFEVIKKFLNKYPLYQYERVSAQEVTFSDKVREICERECPRYGTSWSCPPAVGTVTECREKCLSFQYALVFSTVADTSKAYDMESLLRTRVRHEDITQEILDWMEKQGHPVLSLSSESCSLCSTCNYPGGKCRFPHHMHPCVESHGIVMVPFLEKLGMDYTIMEGQVLWFSILFFS